MAYRTCANVIESTTSTGTGTLTLAGAVVGSRSFATAGVVNTDTFAGLIQAVDATTLLPTGDWELALCTFGTGGIITRTNTRYSSNANAAVNFSSGTKLITIVRSEEIAELIAIVTPTVGASPYTYTNATEGQQYLILDQATGGVTFTALSIKRSGTTISLPLTAYDSTLGPGDQFMVTYSLGTPVIKVFQMG